MRISVGDIMAEGKQKEIMFVSEDGKLAICKVRSTAETGSLKFLEAINDKKHNYPYSEKDLVGASFFDLDDTGTHSILLEGKYGQLKGYLYLSDGSSYFLKALSYDTTNSGDFDPGQSRVGISYQYLMTTIQGKEVLRVGYQSISHAYRILHLPYMLNGLGRCQNYIEYFSFGHYSKEGDTQHYTPVIPNSQLIISKKDGAIDIELLINPSSSLLQTFLVFWAIFLAMAIVTIILHVREVRQDKRERRQDFIITT
eukprot:TRINITY_DN2525_c0_g4_i2.p1 TRINITY_DN2525_c0_g4~~TRINITY_DN2525_c0_g4_i2.p1  ORF type:complete len:255 (+),score=72.27 TRINITY_DN2525_c0_g4_i2:453-1217(+)